MAGKKDSGIYDTNTQLIEALKNIIEANPKQCILHSQDLKNIRTEVQDLADEMIEVNKGIVDINRKLFVSNGELCMSENIRNVKGTITRHIKEHEQQVKETKWHIGTFIAIGAIFVSLIAVAITAWGIKKDNYEMEQVKLQIIKLVNKKP